MKRIMDIKTDKVYRFSILTLGCKTNQSESDEIARRLSEAGIIYSSNYLISDVVIINTCTVTMASDSKVRQLIRKIKKKNPSALLIVTGCYVILNHDFLEKENIGKIFTNEQKQKIPDFVIKKLGDVIKPEIKSSKETFFSNLHTRQLVKIQDGCRQNCTYCIVPFVRNKYISRDPERIIGEINLISQAGLEEIVLTGTHIGKYGIETNDKNEDSRINKTGIYNLKNLLEQVLLKTDIKRIRLSSIEINELSDELVEIIAGSERIAKHLHIPLQSGSDRILKMMKRPYSTESFSKRLNKIKSIIPDISLTTDVIVGFPDESEEDFYKTVNFIEKFLFSKVHVFRFSPRPGTAAGKMENQISDNIKYYRAMFLRSYCDSIRKKYMEKFLKKQVSVLVEKTDKKEMTASGMSEEYVKVMIPLKNSRQAESVFQGRIYSVFVTEISERGLTGELSE